MDFDESPEEATFRAAAREWLEKAADTAEAPAEPRVDKDLSFRELP